MIQKIKKLGDSKAVAFAAFVLPALGVFGSFIIFPIFRSFLDSLYRFDGLLRVEFVGFANYRQVLFGGSKISSLFWNALSNNAYALVFVLVVQTTLGFLLALALFQKFKGSRFFESMLFLPVTLSIVVVGYLFSLMLHPSWGAINQLIRLLGFSDFYFPWLGDPNTALTTILLVNVWRWAGFPALVFLAGLNSIPQSIIEATEIDGASAITRVFRIYIPLLVPQFLIVLILTITGNIKMFALIFSLAGPQGSPGHATDVLGTLFYRTAFGGITGLSDKGLGATIGMIIIVLSSVISITVVLLLQRKQVKLYG
ncbi:MAG: carbohydrate ABC transporter permease [Candidatus Bipolaricaulota bacterium]